MNEIARLVRQGGTKVCVFPINGTRRWFILEHSVEPGEDFVSIYLNQAGKRHVEVYKMLFEHGVDTVLSPIFGPDLLEDRGDDYMQIAVQGFLWFARSHEFLSFCDDCDVRVRIYGDAHRHLHDTDYVYVLDALAELTQRTAEHQSHRLFLGICAHDATESISEISLHFYQKHGRSPNKQEIIETYYGEHVEPVDIFIGFDKFSAFDMPLVATGTEDLYFTVSPSLYLSRNQLRRILHDHLYNRRKEPDWSSMTSEELDWMRRFYRINQEMTLGVGIVKNSVWYPIPQVEWPSDVPRR
jgi:adenosine tuberculosinyltransferase